MSPFDIPGSAAASALRAAATDDELCPDDDGCPYCGGTGVIEGECECEAIESICCCLYPKAPICSHCGGNG